MKKRQNLILRSFGAVNIQNPEPAILAGWIKKQKKACCDLISFKIESQIKKQVGFTDLPCAGGVYYRERITESVPGIKAGFLVAEPVIDLNSIKDDTERLKKYCKNAFFSLSPPSNLLIDDGYYRNRSDFIGDFCSSYRKMMREQRDLGINGHILVADRFDATEMDELSSGHVFFFSPDGGSKVLESILEYQNCIAVYPHRLPVIFELLNEYEIKNITILDASPEDFGLCLDHFDIDYIISGGFCNLCGDDYWRELKERAYVIR